MKIVFAAYRKWAFDILEHVLFAGVGGAEIMGIVTSQKCCEVELHKKFPEIPAKYLHNEKTELYEALCLLKPEIILFYGWSWIVTKEVLEMAQCICLHPSPLPKYRGGSPLQNQILAGEKKSAVSLFFMKEGIDNGPVVAQKEFSLEGSLNDIFDKIVKVGAGLTSTVIRKLVENKLTLTEQDESQATYCKRRMPEDSEITIEEIKNKSAEYIYNKVRALQSPYPSPYIVCGDGKKIYIKNVKLEE